MWYYINIIILFKRFVKVVTPDYEYSMPGYVQLAMGNVIINYYPTMDVVFAGNTENTYNKIQVDFYFR